MKSKAPLITALLIASLSGGCSYLGQSNNTIKAVTRAADLLIVRVCKLPTIARLALRAEFAKKGIDTSLMCKKTGK